MEHIIATLLRDFEEGKMTRRQLIQTLAFTTAAASGTAALVEAGVAADTPAARAVSINHVSYQVADYTKTRDFYAGLFGMKVSDDDGKQCRLTFGDNILIARNRASGTPKVDHIAYTLANWDTDKGVRSALEAELKRRGLQVRATTDSLHIQDPDGFDVQMGGKTQ